MSGKKVTLITVLAVILSAACTVAVMYFCFGFGANKNPGRGAPPDGQAPQMPDTPPGQEQTNEVWNALTDEQKEGIYTAQDAAIQAQTQMIEQMEALGLIDGEAAEQAESRLSEQASRSRANGEMPAIGGVGMGGSFGGPGQGNPGGR